MRARTKVLITAAVAVPLVLAGAGTAYATHYQDRALPGSTLGWRLGGRADPRPGRRDRAAASR